MLNLKPAFSLSAFTFIKRLFSSSSLYTTRKCYYLHIWGYWKWCYLHIWGYWYFSQQSWFQLVLHPAWHFTWCTLHTSWISRGQDTALMYSFPNLESVHCSMSGSNCCFLTCIQIPQEAGQVVWHSHLLKSFPQFVGIDTVKDFGIVSKAEVDVFWNSLAFSMIQWMLAIWSLVPLPFLNPAWTSGSS